MPIVKHPNGTIPFSIEEYDGKKLPLYPKVREQLKKGMINHSFAVLAYQDSPYLSTCLDSLQAQSIKSHIFITTSTPSHHLTSIAKKYGLDIYVTESGQGIAHDWNFGLKQTKTKYVTLAHQDDLYLPEYTQQCLHACEQYKDTLICFTGYSEIVGQKLRTASMLLNVKRLILWAFMPVRKSIQNRYLKNIFLSFGCPIAAPSVMLNLEQINDFQFSSAFSVNMDWDAWSRIAKMEGTFVYVRNNLMIHRIHQDSATTAGLQANARQQEDQIMFKRFWPDPIAKMFAKVYARSYASNKNKEE